MNPVQVIPAILILCAHGVAAAAETEPAPLKVMLITGGCCHDYKAQTEILKNGLEQRIRATVDQVHVDDATTRPVLPIFGNPDYGKGYDLIIHDECAADIKDIDTVKAVLKPHLDGIPAVNLHCAMHSYRTGNYKKRTEELGTNESLWFEFLGLQSSGHGPKKPILISFTDPHHPVTKGFKDWTTNNEELYNNLRVFDTAKALATGTQGKSEAVVVWVNHYGKARTRVFCTTIGHNNETVADARYLDLVANGALWACGKLDSAGQPAVGYGRSAK